MHTIKIDQPFYVSGTERYGKVGINKFVMSHAPEGGRVEDNGPIFKTPFAFTIPCAAIVDGGFSNRVEREKWGDLITVALDEEFIVEGYGVHKLIQKRGENGWLRLVRVSDGFTA